MSLSVSLIFASSLAPQAVRASGLHELNDVAALSWPPLDARRAVASEPDTPGDGLWVKRFNGRFQDTATAVGVSPDGSLVFVSGSTEDSNNRYNYATFAYDSATGARRWARVFDGPGQGDSSDLPTSLGVGPDGSTVFVTGTREGSNNDYLTVAYDATTGTQLWAKRYNGPGNFGDAATALGVSPDGSTVFVTGASGASSSENDYATVAYDANTGTQRWVERYNGPAGLDDQATALAVSSSGSTVFVTGTSSNFAPLGPDEHTVAYDTATGAQLWVAEYQGPNLLAEAHALGVSPDGSMVFVTGDVGVSGYSADYATVAYDTATGTQLWVQQYNGPGNGIDEAHALGVSPNGASVLVTGYSWGSTSFDYATLAYNAATGTQQWVKRFNGPAGLDDVATALQVSPTGGGVYVTGQSLGSAGTSQYGTIAYDASTGHTQWHARYLGPSKDSFAFALGVSPDGSTVFVTGSSLGPKTNFDYATIAYSTV